MPNVSDENSLTPNITVGESFSYSFKKNGGERLKVQYDFPVTTYRQVASFSEVIGSGIFVLGNGLRLEHATLTDTNLSGGIYITDTSYRPLVTLDSHGIIRTLDINISWTVNVENNHVVFTLSKERKELGKIIISGETISNWSGE